jgi:hypothetical protein
LIKSMRSKVRDRKVDVLGLTSASRSTTHIRYTTRRTGLSVALQFDVR